ncbi:tetratricopeptide repeat protein [Winogradskyella sp. 3972H.M.0a.05]|uniref:tetratricopeptide repeat protein n=1 Tax=Winogradskyella sp. 3972H.M.0a.05 TaxID=2950277 RepID=UPI003391C60D
MRFVLVFILLLITNSSYSQQQAENETAKEDKDTILINLEQQYKVAKTDSARVTSLVALAEYEVYREFSEAEDHLLTAVEIVNNNKDLLEGGYLAPPYSILGIVKRRQGDYADAMSYFVKAKETFFRIGDSSNVANIMHNMGVLYRFMGEYPKSIENYKSAIAILEALNSNKKGVAAGYNMLGVSYRKVNQLDSALYCYEKAKSIFKDLDREEDLHRVNGNMAVLYNVKKQYDKSLKLNLENLAYYTKLGNKSSMASTNYNVSTSYYRMEDYPNSMIYARASLKVAQEEGLKQRVSKAYNRISNIQNKTGDFEQALVNYKLFKKHSDSLINDENLRKIQRLEIQSEFRQEKLVDSLQLVKEREVAEANLEVLAKKKRVQFQWMLIGLILFAGLLIYIYVKQKAKRKYMSLQNKLLSTEIEHKKKDLTNFAINISKNQEWVKVLSDKLNDVKNDSEVKHNKAFKDLESEIKNHMWIDESTKEFYSQIDTLSTAFYERLKNSFENLTKTDVRLCSLIKLNMDSKQIAILQNISPSSVKMSRYRLRKKLNLNPDQDIYAFLRDF